MSFLGKEGNQAIIASANMQFIAASQEMVPEHFPDSFVLQERVVEK